MGRIGGYVGGALLVLWLPVTAIGGYFLTMWITGWRDPEGMIQGCEKKLSCAEAPTFFTVLIVLFVAFPLTAAVLLVKAPKVERST